MIELYFGTLAVITVDLSMFDPAKIDLIQTVYSDIKCEGIKYVFQIFYANLCAISISLLFRLPL